MEENMTIRKATDADFSRILEIYAAARAFMCRSGNPTQWPDGYPQPDIVAQDMEKGYLYVMTEGGRIYGCFMLCDGPDVTYQQIFDGQWGYDTPYGVIHRVAGDGTKRGVVAACAAFARQYYRHLRIDTHRDNLPMQRSLRSAGFTHRGTIFLENGDPRLAYDWADTVAPPAPDPQG